MISRPLFSLGFAALSLICNGGRSFVADAQGCFRGTTCDECRDICQEACETTYNQCANVGGMGNGVCQTSRNDCYSTCASERASCTDADFDNGHKTEPACPEIELVQACEGTKLTEDPYDVVGKYYPVPVEEVNACEFKSAWDSTTTIYKSEEKVSGFDYDVFFFMFKERDQNRFAFVPHWVMNTSSNVCSLLRNHLQNDFKSIVEFSAGPDPHLNTGDEITCWSSGPAPYFKYSNTPLEVRCNDDAGGGSSSGAHALYYIMTHLLLVLVVTLGMMN